jgi:4-amino-4-deoxy-L-arabinose transferase-like glycosyltransferase
MSTSQFVPSPGNRATLAAIIVLAVVLRLAAALVIPDPNFPDAVGYRLAAAQLWSTGRMTADYIMPLYPFLVGVVQPGWGQLLLDITLSTASVWLVYLLTSAIFADRLAATLAALGCAIYPHFIFFSVVGLTETLFTTLVVAAMVAWYRGAFTIAAVCAVLSILTRPPMDLLAPVLVLYFALVVHRLPWRTSVVKLLAYVLIYCALMSPWWLHNYRAHGTFIRLNIGGGMAFYTGNNPMSTGGGIIGVDVNFDRFDKLPNSLERDAALWKAGMDYIREHPWGFFERLPAKFARLWRPWPYTEQYHNPFYIVLSVLSFGPVALLALFYLLRWGWRELPRIGPPVLFIGYLTGIHLVTIGSVRYRIPMEPFVIVFAGVAAARLLRSHPAARRIVEPAAETRPV